VRETSKCVLVKGKRSWEGRKENIGSNIEETEREKRGERREKED